MVYLCISHTCVHMSLYKTKQDTHRGKLTLFVDPPKNYATHKAELTNEHGGTFVLVFRSVNLL